MDLVLAKPKSAVARVSIAMSVYNHLDMTERCLASLYADPERPPYDLVVVNNNSSDGTAFFLESLAAKIGALGSGDTFQILTNSSTTCVAAAWNRAIRGTSEPWVAVLSNDIVLTRGWWQGLRGAMEKNYLALASPFPLEGEFPVDFPAWALRFTARNKARVWADYSFVVYAFRRETFDRIGPLDENFQVGGFEDTDYIYRLRQAGLRYGIVGAAVLYHFGSATMKEFKDAGDLHAAPNRKYFIEKWRIDPSSETNTSLAKWIRRWRRWKLRFGYM